MKEQPEDKEIEETAMDNNQQPNIESEVRAPEKGKNDNKAETAAGTPEEMEAEYRNKIKYQEDRYLRLAAEFDNYKKRTARQFDDIVKGANENLISRMLDIVDNFRRALDAAEGTTDYNALHKGTELIYQQFADILSKEGVEKIEAVGQPFDPQLHDAMMRIESNDYPEGMVASELAAGYKLKGKVIRHSKVAVSSGKAPESDRAEENGREE
jgi:molecular chaperone GrpE